MCLDCWVFWHSLKFCAQGKPNSPLCTGPSYNSAKEPSVPGVWAVLRPLHLGAGEMPWFWALLDGHWVLILCQDLSKTSISRVGFILQWFKTRKFIISPSFPQVLIEWLSLLRFTCRIEEAWVHSPAVAPGHLWPALRCISFFWVMLKAFCSFKPQGSVPPRQAPVRHPEMP